MSGKRQKYSSRGGASIRKVCFKARHTKLTPRTLDSLDRARVLVATPEAIEKFFSLYENILESHSLRDKPHLILI